MVEYRYFSADRGCLDAYLYEEVVKEIDKVSPGRVIELGCGNGGFANIISNKCVVVALDNSETGINIAKNNFKFVDFYMDSVYEYLQSKYGKFDCVVSLEVIEHLFDPRKFVQNALNLLNDEGVFILSTPYHGYWKNLLLALSGKLDAHFTALWGGGHIKFWSIKTISAVLEEYGFEVVIIRRLGRIPVIAKTMLIVAQKK